MILFKCSFGFCANNSIDLKGLTNSFVFKMKLLFEFTFCNSFNFRVEINFKIGIICNDVF